MFVPMFNQKCIFSHFYFYNKRIRTELKMQKDTITIVYKNIQYLTKIQYYFLKATKIWHCYCSIQTYKNEFKSHKGKSKNTNTAGLWDNDSQDTTVSLLLLINNNTPISWR